ncbi:MAG: SIS domain-containing protein, partial [Erysipelotrichaceae bacterium]|nr:SIS domain-containing protein [Erysipelotrichaceae bacterium]
MKVLAEIFAEKIENDKIIHTFGTGHSHMLGIELFARAGGLGNVDAMLDPDTLTAFGAQRSGAMEKTSGVSDVIYDSYNIQPGDIMLITS